MKMDELCGSQFWSINETWESDKPEFSACFEKTILLWIPCGFLWITSVIEICNSFNSKVHLIPWNWLNISKIVACGILLILTFSDLQYVLIWHSNGEFFYIADFASNGIKLLTFILAGYIIFIHREYGIRTSAVMSIFWFLLLLCGFPNFISQLSEALKHDNRPISYMYISNMIYYSSVIFMFLLSVIADAGPFYSKYPPVQKPCPDSSVSFLCSWMTLWFDSFAIKFYKKSVDMNKLWNTSYDSSLEYLVPKFQYFWNVHIRKKKNTSITYLLKMITGFGTYGERKYQWLEENAHINIVSVLWNCFGYNYITMSLFKLCSDILNFLNPLLLSWLINFGESNELMWHGYVYAALLSVKCLFQNLLLDWYIFKATDIGIRIRCTLMSIIYKKALKISCTARRLFTVGEITNLMAVDSQRFFEIKLFINMAISGCCQILVATYFLWNILGPSSLAGLAVMITLIPLNAVVANKVKSLQAQQMKNKDERIKITNEVLSGIKTLKMYAWEKSFEEKILNIRKKEINQLRRIAYLNTSVSFIWGCTPFLVSLVSFASFTLSSSSNVLNAQIAFVSLSLFNIIRLPISMFPTIFTNIIQASVAVKRINRFLNAEEIDFNGITHNILENDAVVVKNGYFSWNKMESTMLNGIDVFIPEGSLTAVIGTVGAGKSSLLSALLGEMNIIGGYVNIKGSVGYVPQQPFLLNNTVRENITFSSDYDSNRYEKIIEACSLIADLRVLPAGDSTEIGDKGVNLSGGQKQRINLARAVYHDADVYLLDDPLSAVDAQVAKHIFENVIGQNGLLRKKTRLFVTHSTTYLSETDFIIVMKNGTISDRGTYNELIAKGGYISEFSSKYDIYERNKNDKEIGSRYNLADELRIPLLVENSDCNELLIPQLNAEMAINSISAAGKLTREDFVGSGNIKSEIYIFYFKCGGILLWLMVVLFQLLYQAFTVMSNFSLSDWSTDPSAVTTDATQSIERRNSYLLAYFSFGVGQFIFVFLMTFCVYVAAVRTSKSLHNTMLHRILRWPSCTFDVTPIGQLLNRFSFDVDVIDNTIPYKLLELLNISGTGLSIFFVILYSNPIFTFAIVPIVILYIVIERMYASIMRQLRRLESASLSPVYSHFKETVYGATVIRAFGVESNFITEADKRITNNQRCSFAGIITTRWVRNRMNMLGNAIVFLTAFLVVNERSSSTYSAGIIGLSINYVLQICRMMLSFVKIATDLETNIVSVERLKHYDNTAQENFSKSYSGIPRSWPDKGEIMFRNLKVKYHDDLDFVLRGVTFKTSAQEKIGVVGRTGAGKSSLMLSLFRIIEPACGNIIIDGVDISTVDLYTLRSRITIIPQDPIIFSGSLRFNIDPLLQYSDEKILHVLELVHLKNHVLSLPNKLYHKVSENGEDLSIGHRQLLCLARALLRKTKILILDEATAAVDLETDDFVQRTIRSEFKDCTILTIAHRLNTIMDSDRVMVLQQGLIVECGNPAFLLNSKSSIFYQMAKDAGIIL